jgi:opacity protein-like surface antigen
VITSRALSVTALLILVSAAAAAQQPPQRPTTPRTQQQRRPEGPRVHLEVDGVYRSTTQTLSDTASPTIYAESGALSAGYDVPAGPGFSGGASFRLWRNLGVGVSVSSFSTSFPADVRGSIPNPFTFSQPRTFEGSVSDLARKELAIGIHLRGMFQLSPRFGVSVYAGPTRLSVTQDVITAIQYSEAYPYDTATFSAAQISTDEVNKWGVGAGADIAFYFTRNVGVGLGVKYSGGETDLVSLGSAPLTSKLGGTEFGGGLRLRF